MSIAENIAQVRANIAQAAQAAGRDPGEILDAPFTVVTPDSRNPYRQMYVAN